MNLRNTIRVIEIPEEYRSIAELVLPPKFTFRRKIWNYRQWLAETLGLIQARTEFSPHLFSSNRPDSVLDRYIKSTRQLPPTPFGEHLRLNDSSVTSCFREPEKPYRPAAFVVHVRGFSLAEIQLAAVQLGVFAVPFDLFNPVVLVSTVAPTLSTRTANLLSRNAA